MSDKSDLLAELVVADVTIRTLAKEIKRLKSENAKLREATGWQPIETAPSGKVLLYYPADSQRELSESISISYGRNDVWRKPTHWMPLPQPPAVEGE